MRVVCLLAICSLTTSDLLGNIVFWKGKFVNLNELTEYPNTSLPWAHSVFLVIPTGIKPSIPILPSPSFPIPFSVPLSPTISISSLSSDTAVARSHIDVWNRSAATDRASDAAYTATWSTWIPLHGNELGSDQPLVFSSCSKIA